MILVETSVAAVELAGKLPKNGLIVLDVETHKTDQYYNKELMGVAIGVPRGLDIETYYVLPGVFLQLASALQSCEWIGHNLKFELEICRQNGLDFRGRIWDTQILAHLVYENYPSYELDWLGQHLLGKRKMDMKLLEKIFGHWNKIPALPMGEYACVDLEITWSLFLHFVGKLKEDKLEGVWADSMEYVRTLQLMIDSGIRIDRALVSDLSRQAGERLSELSSQLAALGIRNPGSTVQVRKYLYHDLGLPVKSY